MPSCVLRISGEYFAVDEFLKLSSLRPVAVYRKGEKRYPSAHRSSSTSGFNVEASEAENDIAAQAAEAVRFIRSHRAELERARTYPGVEHVVLDFATLFRDVVVQSERFPAALVAEAASAGMEIETSLYPPPDDGVAQSDSED